MSTLLHAPSFDLDSARALMSELYGLNDPSEIRPLPSERDQNFLVEFADSRYVLKISNAMEPRERVVAQSNMMNHLTALGICPSLKQTVAGELVGEVAGDDQTQYCVRLVSFLEGRTLSNVQFKSPLLLESLGRRLGQIDRELESFDDGTLHYEFDWDLAQGIAVVQRDKHHCSDPKLLEWIDGLMARIESHTVPHLDKLPQSVIHNDANDGNVLVCNSQESVGVDQVAGVIDFGDAVFSWTVSDLAIGIAYAILDSTRPLQDACAIVKGYHAERALSSDELDALFGLVCLRLCVSACMAAKQSKLRPVDEYLNVSQQPILKTLPRLIEVPFALAAAVFRDVCGYAVTDEAESVTQWLHDQQEQFQYVLGDRPPNDELELVDWSVESPLQDNVLKLDLDEADARIGQLLTGGKTGVGRYLEPRLVYASDQFGGDSQEERRTIHLGVDLFANAGTEVVAPWEGVVELLHEIKQDLDYGTLLILRHQTGEGQPFFSLYGHLDWDSTKHLREGQTVKKGGQIAQLGASEVNGGWTPHLHFQLMLDLLDFENDFPGVSRASEQHVWAKLCPNPNLMLGLPKRLAEYSKESKPTLIERRSQSIGGSLSVGYRDPVHVVRGKAQYLFDADGRKYLDAYNNVPHIGHCHPAVIEAAHRQMRLVNTNTRYLSENLMQFAESLTTTMPDPLSVCYVLNSASEANELALRMMRCVTRAKDLVVLEGAYHGHSTSLIDISPYKHDGPGGEGRPDWVHTAPIADIYRGEFRDPETSGAQYANRVAEICHELREQDRGVCGFIAESCPSVGGQIIFPKGYLSEVYRVVREHGGLCVADDVQTGYGRLGQAFYGFELQDVVPDIVVLGKPIGNGHPLAALVTTPEIADRFNNGMEFFSTFGGNNVSCAIGQTVLKVVDESQLQQHALAVGDVLLTGLRKIQSRFEVVGDVRGSGLFLGMELVRDRETLEPADSEASFISNRMRDKGILLGTDGPLHNVIKIRPPMPFNRENAAQLLGALEECLSELESVRRS